MCKEFHQVTEYLIKGYINDIKIQNQFEIKI